MRTRRCQPITTTPCASVSRITSTTIASPIIATMPTPQKKTAGTTGKVALFATCYGNYNSPHLGDDFFKVFRHNGMHIELVPQEQCCGMPKLELGDLDSVARAKDANIPMLSRLIDLGFDIIAPVPSCVLMFKQELP